MNCTRPLSPSLSPWVCSKWCPLSQWCQLTILSSVIPFLFCAQSFPASGSFPVTLHIRWPKYWSFSFSISPSNEYSGLTCLELTGLISLQSEGLSRVFSSTTIQSINSLALGLLYGPTLTYIHDYGKNHKFDYTDLCWQWYLCFLICCLGLL